MNFTVENLEFFLLIVIRISAFIFVAPFFGIKNVPIRLKAAFSIVIGMLLYQILEYRPLEYEGVIGFAQMVVQEAIAGILIGYFANICSTILSFVGQLVDMEIGLSMVQQLDPVTNIQSTITGNIYNYFVMLMFLATNMHFFVLNAIIDTFSIIPVGGITLNPSMYKLMIRFMADYFIIGFRIMLPIFASILLVNIVLGILVKVAPQMNMFVIGMQLKILVGIFIMFLIAGLIPSVSDFIFREMKTMMDLIIKSLAGI